MNLEINQSYKEYTGRKKIVISLVILLIIVFSIFSICAGSSNIKPYQVIMAILGKGTELSNLVIWNIRLPRVMAAIIAGAGLSVAGCVMQSNLRNPLASPSTLGISSAAAFGANLAIIVFGAGSIKSSSADAVLINNPYIVTICAFGFSMVATFIILMIATLRSLSSEAVLLAGVAIGSLFSAGSTLVQYFAQDVQVAAVVFWAFGDLGRASWREVTIMAILIIASTVYFIIRQWDYNAMDSGEEAAKSLGVNVQQVRFGGLFVSSLITAAAVSFLGIIGFIGLIGPQIMRRIIGGDHRFLIPSSALMGSLLLLISDTFARTVISPVILPVGAITSFLGAPMFLYLLMRGYKRK
ncbi:FecCD family ABC transporter permease [Clostridium magnum]|uniref:Hemin transport system permease protein HmuU n=1 Tax=Clostridium magnum DSM 2767 TaxID=1121326 RepID=A0A162TID0_9CLOT|nr:iron ABC transporter permease [Clostridium magnum]KZL92683.1 hemin transport system permease protein HmuU [Clostridium magnum DSM 2767]SHI24460.1 iron complex transport system permease protein [Clostridium magnum DSM 2767]